MRPLAAAIAALIAALIVYGHTRPGNADPDDRMPPRVYVHPDYDPGL